MVVSFKRKKRTCNYNAKAKYCRTVFWTQKFISSVENEINVSPDIKNNSEEFRIVPLKLKMEHKNYKNAYDETTSYTT